MAEDLLCLYVLWTDANFTCGEEPSPLLMLRGRSSKTGRRRCARRGKEFILVVSGQVRGHHGIPDGEHITAGADVWFDRRGRWVRTHTRLFALGEPAGEEIPLEGIES